MEFTEDEFQEISHGRVNTITVTPYSGTAGESWWGEVKDLEEI